MEYPNISWRSSQFLFVTPLIDTIPHLQPPFVPNRPTRPGYLFFPFASQLTVQTASSTFYQHKKSKRRREKREGKENMQTERRDTAEKTIEFDALLKRLSRPLWIRFCGLRETEKLWGRFHRRRADIVSIKQIPGYQRKEERQREKKKEKGSGKRVLLGWRELVKGNAKERERRREERSPRAYSGTKSGWVSEICIDLPVWRIFQRNQPSRENIYEKHDRRSLIFPDLGWI